MRKPLGFLLLTVAGIVMTGLGLSCSTTTPTASNNFQNPIQTIVSINTPFTATPTFTFTPTNTATSTPTITPTFTPYVVSTWTGFDGPLAVAVDGSGNVYVADTGHNQVGKYTANGFLVANWGSGGVKGKISYSSPLGVAVNAAGTSFFVVGSAGQVSQYGSAGNLLESDFSSSVALKNPNDVAVDPNGNVFISDTGNLRVVELNSSGVSIAAFSTGVSIFGIAVDGIGDVFVSTANNTVQIYSSGSLSQTIPGFASPQGLAVDSGGNLYVADMDDKQFEEFAAGSFNQVPLVQDGSAYLSKPTGIAVDPSGNIYVADAAATATNGTNEVFKFAP